MSDNTWIARSVFSVFMPYVLKPKVMPPLGFAASACVAVSAQLPRASEPMNCLREKGFMVSIVLFVSPHALGNEEDDRADDGGDDDDFEDSKSESHEPSKAQASIVGKRSNPFSLLHRCSWKRGR